MADIRARVEVDADERLTDFRAPPQEDCVQRDAHPSPRVMSEQSQYLLRFGTNGRSGSRGGSGGFHLLQSPRESNEEVGQGELRRGHRGDGKKVVLGASDPRECPQYAGTSNQSERETSDRLRVPF